MKINTPINIRDLSRGVYRTSAVNNVLIPQNSVSNSININYDKIIGSAVVRPGTTLLGSVVSANNTPLGLFEMVGSGGTPNILLSVFSGTTTPVAYYYNGSWATSNLKLSSSGNNDKKARFYQLGNRAFVVNGANSPQSSDDGINWSNTSCPTLITPSLIFRSKGRMLAAGDPTYKDRVYFSSIIDPTSSPFITWNQDNSSGDFIDINPDDGSNITGFAETSDQALIFKGQGMYRMNVITKSVDPQNIFNIGAVSQESITSCQGIVYFFTGIDIRRTNGGFPEQISRLGVQDWIDAIPQANWASVASGNDGLNVWFDIGNITLNTGKDDQKTYNNVRLKFSTRDENWSVHSYPVGARFFCNYTNSNGRKLIGQDTSGSVQTIDLGTTDNKTPIYYELETQEQELNRGHLKKISDKVVVFTQNGRDSSFQAKVDGVIKDINMDLSERENIGEDINLEGYKFAFRWYGNSTNTAPIFEGLYIEDIEDMGVTKK